MTTLNEAELSAVHVAIDKFVTILSMYDISLDIQHDFSSYVAIRHDHGDLHLNQAFDPAYASIGKQDFWLRARNRRGEVIATYCVRWFNIDNFYRLIRSQALWFSAGPGPIGRALAFECDIPPFGGEITHGGGLWVRPDWRGSSRLAYVLPRVARALSLSERPFDHDTGMIRNDPRDSLEGGGEEGGICQPPRLRFRPSEPVRQWVVSSRGPQRNHASLPRDENGGHRLAVNRGCNHANRRGGLRTLLANLAIVDKFSSAPQPRHGCSPVARKT